MTRYQLLDGVDLWWFQKRDLDSVCTMSTKGRRTPSAWDATYNGCFTGSGGVSENGKDELDEGIVGIAACGPDDVQDVGHVDFGFDFLEGVLGAGGHLCSVARLWNHAYAQTDIDRTQSCSFFLYTLASGERVP
jgi:hypothetical protein